MAKVIGFYMPAGFQRKAKWLPRDQRGKVIEFRAEIKKSA